MTMAKELGSGIETSIAGTVTTLSMRKEIVPLGLP